MDTSNITNGIPAEVLALIEKNLNECRNAIAPYVVPLTPEERQKLYKVSDGTEPFVEKGIGYIKRFPKFIPQQLNVDATNTSYAVMTGLKPAQQLATDLLTVIDDTRMAGGADTLQSVLCYYNSTRQAAKENISSAKDIYDDMSKRYERKKKEEKKTENDIKNKPGKKKETDEKKADDDNLNIAS